MSEGRRSVAPASVRGLANDRLRVQRLVAAMAFTVLFAASSLVLAFHRGWPAALLAWGVLSIAAVRWPAPSMLAATLILRLGFSDACCTDQIIVSHAAWERVIAGAGGPYGVGYSQTIPSGAPFPYGPLALIWWLPGTIVPLAASCGIVALLAWKKAWITLAVFAVWQPSVWLTFVGVNDYSPALLILLATIVLPSRPKLACVLLAVAAALKPYAFAWFLPFAAFVGPAGLATLALATAVMWSPLLVWGGPGAFLESVRLAREVHPVSENTLNLPALRWAAVPLNALGIWARHWEVAAVVGATTFVVFLFLDWWGSYSYWLVVLPILGLTIESVFVHGLSARRQVRWRALRLAKFGEGRASG